MNSRSYKGWTRPGPDAPGGVEPGPGETLDYISGHYRIFQLEKGHRFSTDDVLTAWYGTSWCPSARRVLDLGSGIGSVGIIAAWRLQGARLVTIEAQDESVALARKSVAYNGLGDRYEIRHGDFRDARLEGEKYDLVLGSPPYFPLDAGVHGNHPQKIACRFEARGTIADYCLTAAKVLDHGAIFACVFPINPPEQLARVEAAALGAGLTIVRRRPVVLKEGEPPLLGLFVMQLRRDLPEPMRARTWIEPALTIRLKNGEVHPEYSAVKLSFGFPP